MSYKVLCYVCCNIYLVQQLKVSKIKKKIVRRHCCKNSTCLSIAYIVKNVFYDLVYNRSFSIYFILSFDSWQQHQYPFINTKSLSRFAEYTIDIYIIYWKARLRSSRLFVLENCCENFSLTNGCLKICKYKRLGFWFKLYVLQINNCCQRYQPYTYILFFHYCEGGMITNWPNISFVSPTNWSYFSFDLCLFWFKYECMDIVWFIQPSI